MNREEAIANLNMISVAFVDPVTKEQRKLIDDTFDTAIKALEQEPCEYEYIKVPKKALKYRTAGMVAYNVEWLKNHFDIERAVICGVQEPCEMTAEEYRQRMIQAFHNADTDELIAICVLPTEKEFEHLEWLLKNHYKKEPCGDAIDRAEAIKIASGYCHPANVAKELAKLPPVNPQPCEDAISRQAVLDAIDVKAWEFCDYLISKNRNDEQKPVSHFADNLRECVREELPSVNLMPCEDAISREMALKECHDIVVDGERYRVIQEETLLGLPSVKPQEPKTGYWIETETDDPYWYRCSRCNRRIDDRENYCPNCGAKMSEIPTGSESEG